MSWTRRIVSLCRRWLHGKQTERELDAEVRRYFDIVVDRLVTRGLSREQAMRSARLALEGAEEVKEKVRQARMGFTVEAISRDIRYACRTLRMNPGFTAVVVLTLGLGIGANSAIFSLINAVMLRALPVQHPENLVLLTDPSQSGVAMETTENGIRRNLSYKEFKELQAHNTVFSVCWQPRTMSATWIYIRKGAGSRKRGGRGSNLYRAASFRYSASNRISGALLLQKRMKRLVRILSL
jgi:hypothetical protein